MRFPRLLVLSVEDNVKPKIVALKKVLGLTPDGAASQELGHCPSRDSDISNASTQPWG